MDRQFQIGDSVRVKSTNSFSHRRLNQEGKVFLLREKAYGGTQVRLKLEDGEITGYGDVNDLELIMSVAKEVPQGIKQNTSEEVQQLYRAGLLNGDLELTEKGKKTLLSILAKEHEDKLLEVADEILGEEVVEETE